LQANEDHEETLDESSTESNSIEVENKTQNSSVKSQADIVNAIEALKSAFEPREFDEIQGYFNF
jgi:galactitol-specific phosphotransferase system IIB component